jgi:hypothetical protein
MSLLADVIRFIHILVIVFVIVTPFIPNLSWTILVLHLATVFTLLAHWFFDNDACFLTMVESKLRGIESHESFVHSIVSPIYKIDDALIKSLVWNITPILGIISATRLYNHWDIVEQDIGYLKTRFI